MRLPKKATHEKPFVKAMYSIIEEYPDARKQVRGNSSSSVMLIVPPTENDLPFSDEIAMNYQKVFDEAKFSTERDCLVIPSSWFGTSRQKDGYEPTKKIIDLFLKQKFNAKFICIGGDGFAFLFGQGKKASDSSITGRTTRPKELNYQPLYYIPYYKEFYMPDNTPKDQVYFVNRNVERTRECLLHLMPSLKEFLVK